jgi:hypothetical protein
MSIGFPTNTVILILALMVGTGVGSWFILAESLRQLPLAPQIKRAWRWGAAIVLSTWLIARLALGSNPPGATVLGTPYSLLSFTFLILGLLVGIVPLLISLVFRQIIRAAPETWVVGIHAIRVGGFVWLALMEMQLLPAEFALSTGYGDMTVGLLALVMAYLLAKRKPYARALVIGWNLLGLLDFVVALTTATLFNGPFAAQLAASGVSLLYFNFVLLIPSFGVPLFGLLHIYSLFQIVSARVDQTTQEGEAPVQTPVSHGEQRSVHP